MGGAAESGDKIIDPGHGEPVCDTQLVKFAVVETQAVFAVL